MTNAKSLLALLAGLIAILAIVPSAGATPYWQSIGGGCVPYNSSIQADGYDLADTGGRVTFTTGTTTNQYFVCPVQGGVDGQDTELHLYSSDPDNSGTNTSVEAVLYRKTRSGGTYSSVCSATSSSSSAWHKDLAVCGTLDTDTYIYWVWVRMIRDSTQATKFYGVELDVNVQ